MLDPYVRLQRADENDAPLLAEGVAVAADAVACWIREGVEDAMNVGR